MIFCVEIWTVFPAKLKIRHWICKYTWHFQDFWSAKKMGGLPKISTSPFNWHLQKHSHNNISIQKKRFLPGRRRVFWAAEEFWKGKEKFQNSKYSTDLEQHHVKGQRMEEQQKAHQEHPSFFIVKMIISNHLYASSSFKSHIILRGCGDRGSPAANNTEKGKKKKNKLVKLQPQLHSSTPS